MPYVQRDSDGHIIGVYARPQPGYAEEEHDGPVEIYVSPAQKAMEELEKRDIAMARVVEDMLAVLEAKGVMTKAELPQSAQDVINERASLRSKL